MGVGRDYTAAAFGSITLVSRVPGKPGYWRGSCACGNPVEKRIDNLKRSGNHSCGKCLPPAPVSNISLEHRVRRLEQIIASIDPDLLPGATPATGTSLTSSVASEVSESPSEPRSSQFSRVTYDAEGDLWEARTLSGKAFFWGVSEEEAAFAARLYLERTHCTFNHRIITDAELELPEERREEIRQEVIGVL